jgi:hypothetical protein
MPRYHNVASYCYDEHSDDLLSHLLEESLRLRAKANGAEMAYKNAAIAHFKRAFWQKFECHVENAVGEIQYTNGLRPVQLVAVKFSYSSEELQIEYRYKTKAGKWAKGTGSENAPYVLNMFRLAKPE